MSRLFYRVMQDNAGNLLFDVSGTMRLAGTGTAATIYGDEALTIPIANPMTNHPSFGSFKCFLGSGDYDFYMAKSGYTFETLTGVQGHGTMAQQDASAVAITGGTVLGLANLSVAGFIGVGTAPSGVSRLNVLYDSASGSAMDMSPNAESGNRFALYFRNAAFGGIGSVSTTATGTAFNTSSDVRLKHAITALTGELDLVRALRPVSFLWNADGTPGVGFLAHEVAAHVQGVITGEQDAVDEDGGIIPQMIDYSKLVPFLVGAIQSLAARVAVLEDALGI